MTTSPAPGTGSAVATENVYDSAGRVVASRVVSDGSNWTCTTYDARGRTAQVVSAAVIGASARTVAYAIDAKDGGAAIAEGQDLENFLDIAADHLTSSFELEGRTARPRFFFRRGLARGSDE